MFTEITPIEIVSHLVSSIGDRYPQYRSVAISQSTVIAIAHGLEKKDGSYRSECSTDEFRNFRHNWGGDIVEKDGLYEIFRIHGKRVGRTLHQYRPNSATGLLLNIVIDEQGGLESQFLVKEEEEYVAHDAVSEEPSVGNEFDVIMGHIDDYVKRMPRLFPRFVGGVETGEVVYDFLNEDFREDLRNYVKRQLVK